MTAMMLDAALAEYDARRRELTPVEVAIAARVGANRANNLRRGRHRIGGAR